MLSCEIKHMKLTQQIKLIKYNWMITVSTLTHRVKYKGI